MWGRFSGFEAAASVHPYRVDFSPLGPEALYSLPLDSTPLVQNAKPSLRGNFRALARVSLWEDRPLVL